MSSFLLGCLIITLVAVIGYAFWSVGNYYFYKLVAPRNFKKIGKFFDKVVENRGSYEGNIGENSFYIKQITCGTKMRHDAISISLECLNDLTFRLRRENFIDRIAKGASVAKEFQTGDADFDAKIYIECDDFATLRQLLTPDRLRHLKRLFDMGFAELKLENCQLTTTSQSKFLQSQKKINSLPVVFETLAAAALSLRDINFVKASEDRPVWTEGGEMDIQSSPSPVQSGLAFGEKVFFAIAGVFLIGSFVAHFILPIANVFESDSFFVASIKVIILAGLLAGVCSWYAHRGTSRAHKYIAGSILSAVLLVGGGLMVGGEQLVCYSASDTARVHSASVKNKKIFWNRHHTLYMVYLAAPTLDSKGVDLKVDSQLYSLVPERGHVGVKIAPGLFGYRCASLQLEGVRETVGDWLALP